LAVGYCFVSYTSLTSTDFGPEAGAYTNVRDLSNKFRIAW
jgi:hypothetical protein